MITDLSAKIHLEVGKIVYPEGSLVGRARDNPMSNHGARQWGLGQKVHVRVQGVFCPVSGTEDPMQLGLQAKFTYPKLCMNMPSQPKGQLQRAQCGRWEQHVPLPGDQVRRPGQSPQSSSQRHRNQEKQDSVAKVRRWTNQSSCK